MKVSIASQSGATVAEFDAGSSFVISTAMQEKAGSLFSAKLSVPIKDIVGYFHSGTVDGPIRHLDWIISLNGYSSQNYPILCFFSLANANRFTIFFDNLTDDFTCAAKLNQRNCTYDITWTFSITSASEPVIGHIDTKPGHWTGAFARAMKTLRPQGIPKFPDGAWRPVYCSWYAAHACLTNEMLDANAKLASELGCGTFIVDDGWCYAEMKRVSPETIDAWYDDIGDWELSETKLPNFKSHVEYAQSLGLKYLLWVAPYFCFKNSRFFNNLPMDKRGIAAKHGTFVYDITDRKISGEVRARLLKIVRDLKIDGLKIDFLDVVSGNPRKPIGRASLDCIKKLSEGIRKYAGPDALIEFRQSYATPQMLDYGTQFRAGDVPFDYLRNISKLASIRVLVGDGVPVHADPLYWRDGELDVTVARHMIASLAAVPMLSMDLPKVSRRHLKIISHYLDFYKKHITTFAKGHWEIRFADSTPTYLAVTRGKERIIIVIDAAHLAEARAGFKGACHILNLSADGIPASSAYTPGGTSAKNAVIPAGGRGVT